MYNIRVLDSVCVCVVNTEAEAAIPDLILSIVWRDIVGNAENELLPLSLFLKA